MNELHFVKLYKNSSSNISQLIDQKTNLFITQSAIEHFENDLTYFEQIESYISNSKKNTIQIHLFPSPICLWLVLMHGVRQYNLRSISKIIDIFKSTDSYFRIYPLGGKYSNIFHFKNFTLPVLLKKYNSKIRDANYNKKLKNVILKDLKNGLPSIPSFYALIIHSNYSKIIF